MEVAVLNKVLVGLGMVAVLGLMVAGVAYAVTGTGDDGRAGEGNGARWQVSGAGGAGGRWSEGGAEVDGSRATSLEQGSVSGVVQSLDGSLLVLQTEAGEVIDVSLGQSGYWKAQGISLAAGDAVLVEGYYEDDTTLSARSVTLVSTGQTVMLRDQSGRPMWAAGRRNGTAGTVPAL
jgi:hypothetical protein